MKHLTGLPAGLYSKYNGMHTYQAATQMDTDPPQQPLLTQLLARWTWNRSSYALMSLSFAVIGLVIVVWWPLVRDYFASADPRYPLWTQLDWLLLGIFACMSLLIMAGADLSRDFRVAFVGLCGGLVIESWGTQTLLWTYYTSERPPLWILPAWPIASLAIDRLVREMDHFAPRASRNAYKLAYWLLLPAFMLLMVTFSWPTLDKSLTWMALLICVLLIITPTDYRLAVLTFAAGSALGYFLELWGTTRACWMYYTLETPPLFAVLAHGLAAVAFWRARLIIERAAGKLLLPRWIPHR